MPPHIVVAGASLAGLRAAEQLRAAGHRGRITVVGEEPHRPYNRPPLSKEALAGRASFDSLTFRTRASVADVDWRLGTPITAAALGRRRVVLAGGTEIPFDGLVVATGLRPRRLACPGPAAGRYVLRTRDDAEALRSALLRPGCRVVVVGAGFIGCEVAATAVGLGAAVTVVDPAAWPMLRPLGRLLAGELLRRHTARGVGFELGAGVAGFEGGAAVTGVRLDDGRVLPADVVVEAVGSEPNTDWLAGNGLDLSDGVLTDEQLRVEGLPYLVAAGDVARFPNPRYGDVPRRVEHWSMPGDSAKHAARVLAGHLDPHAVPGPSAPFAPLPTFWSDQHDFRIQAFGAPALGAAGARILDGDLAGDVVVGYHDDRDGRLVGVVGLGGPAVVAATARYRARLPAPAATPAEH